LTPQQIQADNATRHAAKRQLSYRQVEQSRARWAQTYEQLRRSGLITSRHHTDAARLAFLQSLLAAYDLDLAAAAAEQALLAGGGG